MFQGFDPRVVDFMWGIRFNNERTWFEAHKEEYLTYFYRPMQELCRQAYAAVAEENQDLGLISRLTRIYRDARRLHGRGPYKDSLWFAIEQPGDGFWFSVPSLWFELSPEGWSYGLGYFAPPAAIMARFRARLDRDPKSFEKIVRALSKREDLVLGGEEYKRPKGAAPTKLLSPWYNRKGFILSCSRPNEGELFTPALSDTLVDAYHALIPLYRYLATLPGDPDPRENVVI